MHEQDNSPSINIYFVDDDPKTCELMQRFCVDANISCTVFQNPLDALEQFSNATSAIDLIVSDLQMPQISGIELLNKIRAIDAQIPFIILTGYANVDNAIEALRLGASDFLKKPFDMDELLLLIKKTLQHRALEIENSFLKKQLGQKLSLEGLIGDSKPMHDIACLIRKISDIRCHVIIEGESGTGKELAARAIHNESNFSERPYVVIDCGALTETLLESELFGHEKGAFTGATSSKKGLLESAKGGTVFLDEIGNITPTMQAKLLRVIQEKQITRVGSLQPINIDIRFIVATNKNLKQLVQSKIFRDDLYHRLNVIKFTMPSLRERKDDILILVQHFVELYSKRYQRDVKGFDKASIKKLIAHSWPGNVRELQNTIERNVALADSEVMTITPFTKEALTEAQSQLITLAELEQQHILKVLKHFDNNKELTAEVLGINKSTLWRKLQSFQQVNSIKQQ